MSKDDSAEAKGVMPSVFLVAAVAVVLVAGMVLKTGPAASLPPGTGMASPAPSLPLGTAITPEPTPAVTAPPSTPAPALASRTPEAAPEPEPPPTIEAKPKPAPPRAAAPANPLLTKLATRAESDSGRIAKARGKWTAQLLVACKPETVDRLLDRAGGSNGVYVLPVQVKEDACFRVCFGSYATPKDASAASDLPKALRGKERIGAVEIAKVIP
jgi:septal ring-binding cell division protein DamX